MILRNSFFLTVIISTIGCSNEKDSTVAQSIDTKVKTERVMENSGLITSSYSGVVEEQQNIMVSFFSAGTVEKIHVSEGENVRKGELLATLYSSSARNTYSIAVLEQRKSEDAYNRLKPMHENGSLPPIKMVEVETRLNQARANTEIARRNWEETKLYAPSDGMIGKVHYTMGMNVAPGVPVMDLLTINNVFVKIPVPENEISKIEKETKARVTIPALRTETDGVVKKIGVVADVLSHTYPVKIEVVNSGQLIKPGMVCSVKIFTKSDVKGYLVSPNALQMDIYGNQYVFAMNEQKRCVKKLVKTISLVGDKVLIEGNLEPNVEVVIAGHDKVKPQVHVNAIR